MKRIFALLIVCLACVGIVTAGDVTIILLMTTGPSEDPDTTFPANTPKLYAILHTKGGNKGDKIRGVLIAEDVGRAAAPNAKMAEKTLDLQGGAENRNLNFSKAGKLWPLGKYRVEIYLNDHLATAAKFTISRAKRQSDDGEQEQVSGE